MPAKTLAPSYRPGSYLAFLGRLTKEKGPETVIHLAKATGLPLRMAAKIPRSETRCYKECLQPIIDGQQIQLVGELKDAGMWDLLKGASALLFLIDWPEPFGLLMAAPVTKATSSLKS